MRSPPLIANPRSQPIIPAPDALAALRGATAERHERLDASLAIGQPGADLAAYRAHLCMLRGWLAPMAAWLARFDDGPQAVLPPLDRLTRIDADLADPAMPPGPCQGADTCPWPQDASAAYRWGACYVLEGAQLGGAVLYRRLAAALSPHPLRYLQGDPDGPGPRWRAYLQALGSHVSSEADIAAACQGACDAFDRLLTA